MMSGGCAQTAGTQRALLLLLLLTPGLVHDMRRAPAMLLLLLLLLRAAHSCTYARICVRLCRHMLVCAKLLLYPGHAHLCPQVEGERDTLKQQVSGLEAELEAKAKSADSEHKKLEELTRERDILTKLRSQVCAEGGGHWAAQPVAGMLSLAGLCANCGRGVLEP